ncbi:MAG: 30S ribosomal protein S9 [Nanoarchaeota archaeon]|nr:30S ribosomal protein S9 [Nanoarchaeota archaeon]
MKDLIVVSGKRKRSIARATLKPGKGVVRINKLLLENVKPKLAREKIKEVLAIVDDTKNKFDIDVAVKGGGIISQASAISLAIGRAISQAHPELKEQILRYDRQFLVADVRRKETRKPNRHGKARSKTQKSYR